MVSKAGQTTKLFQRRDASIILLGYMYYKPVQEKSGLKTAVFSASSRCWRHHEMCEHYHCHTERTSFSDKPFILNFYATFCLCEWFLSAEMQVYLDHCMSEFWLMLLKEGLDRFQISPCHCSFTSLVTLKARWKLASYEYLDCSHSLRLERDKICRPSSSTTLRRYFSPP